jgi:alpha-glucosidase
MQSVFWYDKPSHYEGEPEVEYFKHLPTVWDDSKVLDGSIGEYATIARRRGDDWFVGSITNELARERDIKLDFLEEGRIYIAYIYSDMLDAKITRTNVAITERGVDRATELRMLIAPNGGQAMRIVPKR